MKINEDKNVLKGQHNLAQGNALGLRTNKRIVRATRLSKEKLFFRTKMSSRCFLENNVLQSRPKEVFHSKNHFLTDGFRYALFTQGVALG